ncbi:MAG TPA: sigma-70 family RNA polymerase sigma factor [Candidatus Eisenbacteria bacterium]|nr:sigma-70 family RNA polymerase sigma factor [Candidatus Eisenbacteria bacterium]
MTAARPDQSKIPDDELVRLVREGESDAFAELVRRTRRDGYRLARRILRVHEEADDALQESYVKAFRALDRFEPGRAFAPWFLTIVARTALSALRQGNRRAAVSLDDPAPEGSVSLAERLADPAEDPREREQRLLAERAFESLSDEHRAVLALRVGSDLSYAEIAAALDLPVGTVMSRLARAREALLERMRELSPKRRTTDFL